jgi:hypothetical protein
MLIITVAVKKVMLSETVKLTSLNRGIHMITVTLLLGFIDMVLPTKSLSFYGATEWLE